jgi:integrative and conjugative element protein (TIGR02256 family)
MSDGRLSIFAAGMSEHLLERQGKGLSTKVGEILIGTLDETKLGVAWQTFELPPVTTLTVTNGEIWNVHIHVRALTKIQAEVDRWPHDETGGVLLGRLSEATRTFNIVDIIPAPEDSIRSPEEFIIGTKGISKIIDDYAQSTGWALYCLGTWHSHPVASGPSQVDRIAARTIALARLAPSILLIHTPTGFRGLIADTAVNLDDRK